MRYIVSLAVLPVLAAGADLTQADWSKLETASDHLGAESSRRRGNQLVFTDSSLGFQLSCAILRHVRQLYYP